MERPVFLTVPEARPDRAAIRKLAIARGLALFLGGFSLVNLAGSLRVAGFDLNLWWIDLRWLPNAAANSFLFLSGLLLAWFAMKPPGSRSRRAATAACTGLLLVIALANCWTYYSLVFNGAIVPAVPLPLSLLVAASLGLILREVLRSRPAETRTSGWAMSVALAAAFGLLFPLAQMVLFGTTDYRRPADVAVVMGARVYEDGRLSDALADRVRTACDLYRQGFVGKLIMSGGPGDGSVHETEGMARAAIRQGVRAGDIVLDPGGLNTERTVGNTRALFQQMNASRVLVVSHGYHLPRIKLAYQRAGTEVCTVPARESYFLRQMPYNMAREVAALWVYYFRPLARR